MRHVVFLMFIVLTSTARSGEPAPFAVVGYLPSYRAETFRAEQAAMLTDVILFSVEPRADGSVDDSRMTPELVRMVDGQLAGTKVRKLLTVGGWGKSDAFARVTADAKLRARVIRELSALCDRYKLNGIDVDWEHPAGDDQQRAYATFLGELHQSLASRKRLVTVAVAPWKPLTPDALAAVDRIHLMAYDNGGRHSTLDLAFDSADQLLRQGVPARKICLGIPFYGRPHEGKFGEATTYAEIVEQYPLKPGHNEAGGIYFNGPELVARKVQLARRLSLGGVMIWELGQDTTEAERSLLYAIHQATK